MILFLRASTTINNYNRILSLFLFFFFSFPLSSFPLPSSTPFYSFFIVDVYFDYRLFLRLGGKEGYEIY